MRKQNPKQIALTGEQLDHLNAELDKEYERAYQRLGSPEETLQWYLDFADMNLKDLASSELRIQGSNLVAAINTGRAERNAPLTRGWAAQLNDKNRFVVTAKDWNDIEMLQNVQQEIRRAINILSTGGFWQIPVVFKIGGPDALKFGPKVDVEPPTDDVGFRMSGFMNAILDAGKYLRACTRCKKPFVKTKRQEYCSINCSQIFRNEKKKQKKLERRKRFAEQDKSRRQNVKK